MKIILIVPPISLFQMHGNLAPAGSQEPSLGLCCIAACLREAGYKVKIIDALALRLSLEEVVNQVLVEDPDFVGLTAVTLTIERAHQMAKSIEKSLPDIRILIGGAHVTALPYETMQRYPEFDYGIIGEGEKTVPSLLEAIYKGDNLAKVKGIVFRQDNKLIATEPAEYIDDLDSLPLPAWDLLPDLATYYHVPAYTAARTPSSSLITTRGCGFKCAFCFQKAFGSRVRTHSAGRVLEMIEILYRRYGIRDFRIVDDNFALFRERIFSIAEGLKEKRLDITFSCLARVDTLTEDIVKVLKSAGCWQISFGIESGVQRLLDLMRKNITLEQIKEALVMVHRHGIRTLGYFMIGFPTEREETIKQTMNFSLQLPLDDFKMQFLTPLPGSSLYNEAEKYGTFDKQDYAQMNTDTEPSFIPFGLSKKQLIFYQKKAFGNFYFRPRIIGSYLMSLLKNPIEFKKYYCAGAALTKFVFSKG